VVNLRHDTFIVLYSNLRAVPTQQIQHRPCRISHGDTTASFASARAPQILTKSPRSLLAPETLDYSTDACFPLQGTPGRCLARNFTCLFATQTPGAYRTLPWMDHSRLAITYPDFPNGKPDHREWRVTSHASIGSDLPKVDASSESFHDATT
jgi:hypothetical protein